MSEPCDLVAERVALGEPLGELAEHAASCPKCRRLAALPAEIGAVHKDIDAGLGFTARMTIGAQQRFAARRRNRRVAVGAAAAVAVAAGTVLVVTRTPAGEPVAEQPPAPAMEHRQPQPQPDEPKPGQPDPDLEALVQMSRAEHAMDTSARWGEITQPLAPYKTLVKGITP